MLIRRACRDDFGEIRIAVADDNDFGMVQQVLHRLNHQRSQVRDMMQDEMDAAMVRAINEIGHIQGVKTIAEFVETDEILGRLLELGVDYAQGHSIAAPRPVEELFRVVPEQKPCLSLIRSRL